MLTIICVERRILIWMKINVWRMRAALDRRGLRAMCGAWEQLEIGEVWGQCVAHESSSRSERFEGNVWRMRAARDRRGLRAMCGAWEQLEIGEVWGQCVAHESSSRSERFEGNVLRMRAARDRRGLSAIALTPPARRRHLMMMLVVMQYTRMDTFEKRKWPLPRLRHIHSGDISKEVEKILQERPKLHIRGSMIVATWATFIVASWAWGKVSDYIYPPQYQRRPSIVINYNPHPTANNVPL